jgi:DNA-directed RNA polymerase subunit RPC12/RpoP
MKLEQCPHCSKRFKARDHLHNFGLAEWFTPRMPNTRLAQEFTVRCPECGNAFISSTLRIFGLVSYAQLPWFIGIFVVLIFLANWLL